MLCGTAPLTVHENFAVSTKIECCSIAAPGRHHRLPGTLQIICFPKLPPDDLYLRPRGYLRLAAATGAAWGTSNHMDNLFPKHNSS